MFKRACSIMLVFGLLLAIGLPALAQDDAAADRQAIEFLLTMQNEDGGFSNGWAPESDISTTADVVLAAVAVGQDPTAFFAGPMMNPFSYLGMQVQADNVTGAGQLAKVLTAVVAAGKAWDVFAGHDLVQDLLAQQNEEGIFGFGAFDHCLSMVALQNAGAELPDETAAALVAAQNEDGGWGFMAGEASDTNTTGICLQALALADQAEVVGAGFDYLRAIQNEDGGWPYQNPSEFGTASDANSTALVVQALLANGHELAEWNSPQEWLLSLRGENGAFSYQPDMPVDVLATAAALPAVNGIALNVWAPALEATE